MSDFELILKSKNWEMVLSWSEQFAFVEAVTATQGDILEEKVDAVVSPANSFGYMDGGLDLQYSQFFGWDLEKRLRSYLLEEHDGELPVGEAVIIPTLHQEIPFLVSAPTMRVPMNVAETVNAYLALRAVIREVKRYNQFYPGSIKTVACPAFCTGEGRMPFERCARQMAYAWKVCVDGEKETMGGLARAVEQHIHLLK